MSKSKKMKKFSKKSKKNRDYKFSKKYNKKNKTKKNKLRKNSRKRLYNKQVGGVDHNDNEYNFQNAYNLLANFHNPPQSQQPIFRSLAATHDLYSLPQPTHSLPQRIRRSSRTAERDALATHRLGELRSWLPPPRPPAAPARRRAAARSQPSPVPPSSPNSEEEKKRAELKRKAIEQLLYEEEKERAELKRKAIKDRKKYYKSINMKYTDI